MHLRTVTIAISAIRSMAANRPHGYFEDVCSHGEIEDDFLLIEEQDLIALRAKYGKNVTPRIVPVPATEAERCKMICQKCAQYAAEIETCLDAQCGCLRSEDRRQPWFNRKTVCRFWVRAEGVKGS